MYFKDFPKFLYDFKYGTTDETKTSVVTDITRNIRFRRDVLANIAVFDEYDIKDGETPEIIAEKVYGNPNYHWIIMLANERFHYVNDFPLEYVSLLRHAADKYNPTLYSSTWYIDVTQHRLYFKIDNKEDAFNPAYLTTSLPFTVSGQTSNGTFTISETWGGGSHSGHSGIDYATQYFWVGMYHGNVLPTGTPVGTVTINTTGRENNPIYFENADGYKVDPAQVGAIGITGLQEEERANEAKRRIKLISPDLISIVLKQYKEFM